MFKNWFKRPNIIKIEPQILELKPDDTLVLSYEYNLTDQQFEILRKQLTKSLGSKHKVILLEGGWKLRVLRWL